MNLKKKKSERLTVEFCGHTRDNSNQNVDNDQTYTLQWSKQKPEK